MTRSVEEEDSSESTAPASSEARKFMNAGLIVIILTTSLALKNPQHMLSQPYWGDEAWVVDSTRAPLSQLKLVTSSTPVLWTAALRLIPNIGGAQRYRLLTLAFLAAAIVAAYSLGFMVGGRGAGIVAALCMGLFPAGAIRYLKQYTADAFFALLILLLLTAVERRWSRRRLGALVSISILALTLSHAAMFVALSALIALALAAAVERNVEKLRAVLLGASTFVAVSGIVFLLLSSAGISDSLRRYWSEAFVPRDQGFLGGVGFVLSKIRTALTGVHLGAWMLVLLLVGIGAGSLYRKGYKSVALVPFISLGGMVLAGYFRLYPFLDPRTSTFYSAILVVFAGLGLTASLRYAVRQPVAVPFVTVALALALFDLVPAVWDRARAPLPAAAMPSFVNHVQRHRAPGDVVVVDYGSSFSFAYYWPDPPIFESSRAPEATVLFTVAYPDNERIVVAAWRDSSAMNESLDRAGKIGRRLWLILSTHNTEEFERWRRAAAMYGSLKPVAGLDDQGRRVQERWGEELFLVELP